MLNFIFTGGAMVKANKREIGFEKEKTAADFLKKRGYKIVELNFKAKCGEIDIIAKDKKILVFIEVKYRSCADFVSPVEAVNLKKQRKIIKTSLFYLRKNKIFNADFRFDIVSILGDKIDLIEGAFTAPIGMYYN
jgi:putative endonuclease